MRRPPRPRPRRRPRLLALLLAAAAAAACAPRGAERPAAADTGAPAAAHAEHAAHAGAIPAADAPDAPDAPDALAAGDGYSLYDLPSAWRDQRGAPVRWPDLAGKVRVVAMVYTSCHATCPLILADLKRVEASLPAGREGDVGFVLVSLDPERDTPGRLDAWARETRLDPARWTLLNGSADAVRELAATLGVRYQPQADGELAHTNAVTVLDREGRVAHQQVGLGAAARGTVDAVAALLR